MGEFHHRVFGMTTTTVFVEFLNKNENKRHPTGKHWVNDGVVPALPVYQLVRAEREVGAWMVHRWKNLRSTIFGCTYLVTSHCAWYFIWYALEMQCLHLTTKAQLLTCAFPANIKLFSETQFYLSILKLYVLAMMDYDGSHFLLNMWVWKTWVGYIYTEK